MTQQNSASIRVSWIDTLRTISIFSIVLVHTGRISNVFIPYVISFYMPVFFFISGLFLKESICKQAFIDFAKTRCRRLLIPYLTFGVISYLLWIFLFGKLKGDVLPEHPVLFFLANTLYGVSGYGWFEYNVTLWFFPCLLVTELLFFFLVRLPSRKILIAILFLLSVIGYFYFYVFNPANFRLPFGIDIALTAVVFYGIGYLVRPYVFDQAFKVWYSPPFLLIGVLAYLVFSNLNPESAFVIGNFGKNYFYFYLAALSGILFWLQCSRLIQPNRLFEEIGKNTLVIFPLHLLLFPFFTGVLVYLFKVPKTELDNSSIVGLLYAIAAILILVPVAWALNRYTPFLLGKPSKSSGS
jgi:fucose 4-O-acetylase-like acetyltransferase